MLVNFASYRSVYDTCIDAFNHPQLRTLAIIAEGVPERQTREIIQRAAEKQVQIAGGFWHRLFVKPLFVL